MYFMVKINTEIYPLPPKTINNKKEEKTKLLFYEKMLQTIFVYIFQCNCSCKNDYVNWTPASVAQRKILTKMANIRKYQKVYAVFNHQFVDIHRTNKYTENMLGSCSILSLKTLFNFISHCISILYIESACVSLERNGATAILHLHSQEANFLMKSNYIMRPNTKLFDIFASFHFILNDPRILYFSISVYITMTSGRIDEMVTLS